MARIGLVAGEGRLPIVFSAAAKDKGDTVIAFGLKGITDPALEQHVHKIHWLEWGKWQKGLLLLASERINKIIMLGKLKKETFFKQAEGLDGESKKMLKKLGDKKDYAILNEAAKYLKKLGVDIIDSTLYLADFIPRKGTLTKRGPGENEWEDIKYGQMVAKSLSGFDAGQTVAVKDKTVIALEAMEGTDETISRAGALVRGGFVVVKVARPDQDMRFDVPLVGRETLSTLVKAEGSVLALEADKTLLMDRAEVIKLADENDISIVII
ncbi:MAG: UDP-2,3-diacylglucosamine diphosphatase LpxI [Candidatus Omnitrophica bacterium]|nr:UDP-2,3-diacylglucosamine diphosphatase LpxI [Candidatus Omnitrophota bacterium]